MSTCKCNAAWQDVMRAPLNVCIDFHHLSPCAAQQVPTWASANSSCYLGTRRLLASYAQFGEPGELVARSERFPGACTVGCLRAREKLCPNSRRAPQAVRWDVFIIGQKLRGAGWPTWALERREFGNPYSIRVGPWHGATINGYAVGARTAVLALPPDTLLAAARASYTAIRMRVPPGYNPWRRPCTVTWQVLALYRVLDGGRIEREELREPVELVSRLVSWDQIEYEETRITEVRWGSRVLAARTA